MASKPNPGLTSKPPGLRRRTRSIHNIGPLNDKAKLERVLGLTVGSRSTLSCDQKNGFVAYAAGSTVVLWNGKNNRQAHFTNNAKKTITCVAYSPDGRFVATGETGHEPAIRVYDVETKSQTSELKSHKFGISCVSFSPNMKYLVSVGNHHDMVVNVWNWKNGIKVATNKISCKVSAISFSESGQFFVTVGVRHVKFWYLERTKPSPSTKYHDTAVPLQGRSAILSEHRNNIFCDVICGNGKLSDKTYAITQSGLLCEFNARRMLERWVDFTTSIGSSVSLGWGHLFVGCAEGIVRVFNGSTLEFITNLPRPHHLGVDVAQGLSPDHLVNHPRNAQYPDVVALCVDENHHYVTVVYNDRSIYQWDTTDINHRIGKINSNLNHCGPISAMDLYPQNIQNPLFPPGTFFTCGSDDTVRIWNCESVDIGMNSFDGNIPRTNIYSSELMKILYLGPDVKKLCDNDNTFTGTNFSDKLLDNTLTDGKSGIRAIRISPDGLFLASGDRSGNVRIHDLRTFNLLSQHEAHDSDVLCLEYSDPNKGPYMLASASRDRLLHVYDVNNEYQPICTIDDHSSSITAIRFITTHNGQTLLLSCGADKCIIFRQMITDPDIRFIRIHYVAAQSTLCDMLIDPLQKTIIAACQDRQIRTYSIQKAKAKKSLKGTLGDDGGLLKLCIDPSGQFVASSCSDKSVSIIELSSGECVANVNNYSDLVTGLQFSIDCKHLLTVSNDGCIHRWRLNSEITKQMLSNIKNNQLQTANENSLLTVDVARSINSSTDSASDNQDDIANIDQMAGKQRQKWNVPIGQEDQNELLTPSAEDNNWTSNLGEARFGSLANVRLLDELENEEEQSPVIYVPDAPANAELDRSIDSFSKFQVQERSEVLKRGTAKSPYSRSDTFGNDVSDEEEDLNMNVSSRSVQNLHTAQMEQTGRQRRKQWDVEPKTYNTMVFNDQITPDAIRFNKHPPSETFSPPPTEEERFSRGSSDRESLTQRYLKRSTNSREKDDMSALPSPSVPPVSSLQFHRPGSGQSSSPTSTTRSDYGSGPLSTSRSAMDINTKTRPTWQPNKLRKDIKSPNAMKSKNSDDSAFSSPIHESPVDMEILMRAKSLNQMARLKERRLTLPNVFPSDLADDDYNSSDLHLRSRSQSPAATGLYIRPRRDSLGSDLMRSNKKQFYPNSNSRLLPTRAMAASQSSLSLHPAPRPPTTQQSATQRRLSDVRDKLRKSTENLSIAPETAQVLHSPSVYGALSRSKSIGVLTSQNVNNDRQPTSSLLNALAKSRALTKSVGNLQTAQGQRSLADTIQELKRASNPDLTKVGVSTGRLSTAGTVAQSGSYYERPTTLPRHKKGGVQKKIESTRNVRSAYLASLDGGTDSDSASDVTFGSGLSPSRRTYTRRYQPGGPRLSSATEDSYYEPASPVTNVERRRLIDSHRSTTDVVQTPPRRSYLADKVMTGDDVMRRENDHMKEEKLSQDHTTQKMARHVTECLEQFQTSLDKTLQAYQLVLTDQEMTPGDRERLQSILVNNFEGAYKRLSHTLGIGERTEPEGGHDDRSNGALSPQTQQIQKPNLPALPNEAEIVLEQYSDKLVELIQRKMGSQK